MTRDEAVAQIKRGLTFRSGSTLNSDIEFELREAQRRVESGEALSPAGRRVPLPWFLKTYDQTLSLVADVSEVNLPDNFLAEDDGEGPYYTPADASYPTYLRKWTPEGPNKTAADFTAPRFYQIRKTTLKVFPTPKEAFTLYWSYYAKDTVLTSNIENEWLKEVPTLLIGLAGQEIAMDTKNSGAVEKFSALYGRAVDGLEVRNYRRDFDNRRMQMGEG